MGFLDALSKATNVAQKGLDLYSGVVEKDARTTIDRLNKSGNSGAAERLSERLDSHLNRKVKPVRRRDESYDENFSSGYENVDFDDEATDSGQGSCDEDENADSFVVQDALDAPPVRAISAGEGHVMAIAEDGTLWAWGRNWYGQLGDGTTTNPNAPVRIGGAANWVSVSAGERHTVAIREDGTLWAWGNNQFGRTGLGTTSGNTTSPVQIGTATNWIHASAGEEHNVAIRSDGSLWAWGRNIYGQLGDGTTTNRATPVQIEAGTKWAYISAGASLTLAIKENGSLWAWGLNSTGQLGDGTMANRNAPVQIQPGMTWKSASAGEDHNVAIRSDGTLWAWGRNDYGQLGDDTIFADSEVPVQIQASTTWTYVSAGDMYTMAIRSDGTLWAWGGNDYGQLGDGTTTDSEVPVQIQAGTTWTYVSAGDMYTMAIRSDGTLWAWGGNDYGQLGDGTTTDRGPTQIMIPVIEQEIIHKPIAIAKEQGT